MRNGAFPSWSEMIPYLGVVLVLGKTQLGPEGIYEDPGLMSGRTTWPQPGTISGRFPCSGSSLLGSPQYTGMMTMVLI